MSKRKYSFDHLTTENLEKIDAAFPNSGVFEIVKKPNYRVLAMLADCKVPMPEGILLVDETSAFLQNVKPEMAD